MHYEDPDREWDEAEEPKEALPEDEEEDYPTTPVTKREQQHVMGDLYRSLTRARDERDTARTFYTQEAISALQ